MAQRNREQQQRQYEEQLHGHSYPGIRQVMQSESPNQQPQEEQAEEVHCKDQAAAVPDLPLAVGPMHCQAVHQHPHRDEDRKLLVKALIEFLELNLVRHAFLLGHRFNKLGKPSRVAASLETLHAEIGLTAKKEKQRGECQIQAHRVHKRLPVTIQVHARHLARTQHE
jgi:hypothetical protein